EHLEKIRSHKDRVARHINTHLLSVAITARTQGPAYGRRRVHENKLTLSGSGLRYVDMLRVLAVVVAGRERDMGSQWAVLTKLGRIAD
ncbi:hypothetical protein, partial [Nesterenkonia sp. E16_7]|uniref:hypothetical protein n=1 Tax=Nesterenkonia sp. E16_7 TaxID=2789294 RepID=UPI001A9178BE